MLDEIISQGQQRLFGPEMLADPYPYYARLRSLAPVFRLALLRHPDQLDRLRRDRALAPSAVEELLRFDSPVQFTSRVLKADLEVGGRRLAAGETAMLLLGSANRDPEQFSDPDRLDVGRPDNKHLAFDHGPHFCLGVPLARLEGRVVFQTLLRRVPGLLLAGRPPEYRDNFNLRGLKSLDVACSPQGPA
jgi:cytochrome P450